MKKLRAFFHFLKVVEFGEGLVKFGLVEGEFGKQLGMVVGDEAHEAGQGAKVEAGAKDKFSHSAPRLIFRNQSDAADLI